ncbi:MAG TPA: hypothetical protein VM942_10720 [Acidimicrobiales bacterium]|nr:hypothetical protein [Acidimicrobiales bacterium]
MEPPRPKARRLQAGHTYRDAVLAELSPERKAVAEQILRGGIPAVRQAVEEQNAQAREVGGPEIKVDALLAVAEELLPALRAAEWRDRAEAAVVIVDEISVRDLRAVVSGADTARDEEGRALASRLREALDRRSAAERQSWVDEIVSSLGDGRIVRALRISGRPPEPGMRFPAELAQRLSEAAGEALTPDTAPDRWAAVLEAVLASPVRRTIAPKGLPAEPGEALTKALRLAGPRLPAVAALLGDPPGLPPRRPPRPPGPRVVSDPTRPPGRPATPPPGRPGIPPPPRPPAGDVGASAPALAEPEPEPASASAGPTPDVGAADRQVESEPAAVREPGPEADVEVAAAPGEAESSSATSEKDAAAAASAEEFRGPASLDMAAPMPPAAEAPNGVADLSSGLGPDTEPPAPVESPSPGPGSPADDVLVEEG